MKFRTLTSLTTVALFGVLIIPVCLAAQNTSAKIITFQAPGADTTAGSFNGTWPSSVNNWGAITGYYYDVNGTTHGFLRSREGKFTTFEAPGADTTPGNFNGTNPQAINDLGAITGYYYDVSGTSHGFLLSPDGKFTTFEVPGPGVNSVPIAFNLEGAIVGYYADANFVIRAFLRSPDGKFTTWVGPGACEASNSDGCFGSGGSNINVFGRIAGGFEDNSGNFVHHGLVRSLQGKLTRFDVPGAGTGSYQGTGCPGCFLGLNQSGAIAGTWSDANDVFHGFLRSPEGEFTKFDAPGAGTGSYQGTGCFSDCPVGLNDWGLITGSYMDANYTQHGFLRSPSGKFTTLDPSGSQATQPASINDFGAITGVYVDANSVLRGFLRIP